ncbi:MAG: type IV pili methyl-accepting chemotaxis transducer N-terminal domain-containing protein, partial [Bacteroidota bacterium]
MSRKYVIGIGIAIVVLLVNQIFIQYQLGQMESDASLINLAGRQRMLSQQINLEWYEIHFQGKQSQAVTSLFEEWKAAHHHLLDQYAHSRSFNAPAIKRHLTSLTPYVELMEGQVEGDSISALMLKQLTQNQADFLEVMNDAVNLMQQDSERKLFRIKIIEIVLLLVSLGIIILEVIHIFLPIEKRLTGTN